MLKIFLVLGLMFAYLLVVRIVREFRRSGDGVLESDLCSAALRELRGSFFTA